MRDDKIETGSGDVAHTIQQNSSNLGSGSKKTGVTLEEGRP